MAVASSSPLERGEVGEGKAPPRSGGGGGGGRKRSSPDRRSTAQSPAAQPAAAAAIKNQRSPRRPGEESIQAGAEERGTPVRQATATSELRVYKNTNRYACMQGTGSGRR